MATNETSTAARIIRIIAIAILILLPVSGLGTRLGLWPFTLGLLMLSTSLIVGVVIQAIAAIWLLRKPTAGTKTALYWSGLFALPSLIVFAITLQGALAGKPAIHNISTDTLNPPQFVAAIAQRGENSNPLEYSAELAKIQSAAYPDLATMVTTASVSDSFQRAENIFTDMGWEIYSRDAENGTIEAVDTTLWFGFKDDIIVRIVASDGGSKLDLRSVSRVGVSDLGVNADRIRAFRSAFDE